MLCTFSDSADDQHEKLMQKKFIMALKLFDKLDSAGAVLPCNFKINSKLILTLVTQRNIVSVFTFKQIK